MPFRERLRAAVRLFLGLDDLATKQNLGSMLKMQQTYQHETAETLARIEQRLNAVPVQAFRHVPRVVGITDWDAAQAEALIEQIKRDPAKDN